MIKCITMFSRRPEYSPEAFSKRWLDVHAALVRKHAATLGIRRYVQSHRVDSAVHDEFAAARGWAQCEFDGVTEIWFDSLEAVAAALATPEGQAASLELMNDENEFIDPSRVQLLVSEEHIIC